MIKSQKHQVGAHEVWQDPSGRQACSGGMRSLQKSLFDSMGELSRLSDSNQHTLRYLVRFSCLYSFVALRLMCFLQVSSGMVNSNSSDTVDAVVESSDRSVAAAPAKRVRA